MPGLWQAAAQIATPHLRNMGTLGGNLCLDTRCTYYDQSYEWRKAIDFCMKKDGAICWVATSSPKCLAVSSTDTAPMLLALGARVRLVSHGRRALGRRGRPLPERRHPLPDAASRRDPDLDRGAGRGRLAEHLLEAAPARRRSTSRCCRSPPRCGVGADGTVEAARVVLGAVASRPMAAPKAEAALVGRPLTDAAIADAADGAYEVAKPMDNTDFDLVWRKRMSRALVGYALRELRGDDMRETRLKLARQSLTVVS